MVGIVACRIAGDGGTFKLEPEIKGVQHHVDGAFRQIDAWDAQRLFLVFDRHDPLERVLDEGDRVGGIPILDALLVCTWRTACVEHPEAFLAELQNAHGTVGDAGRRKEHSEHEILIAVSARVLRQDRIDDSGGALVKY